jgi:capsular polysaccharide biosynthesis protein
MGEQALDIRSGLAVLRRHRAVLVGATALGLAAGIAYTTARPPLYTSASMVLLPEQASADQTPRDPGTEQRVAGSAAVLGPAGRTLQPKLSAAQMAAHVSASAPSTTVVAFKASADSPAFARKLAQAAAVSEVAYVRDTSSAGISAQQRDFTERLDELNGSLDSLAGQILSTTKRRDAEGPTTRAGRADSTALAQLTAQQADLVLQRDQVKQQAQTAAAGIAPSTATIIEPAADGHRPALPNRMLKYGAIGAGLALLLATISLTLFARRDRRLRYRDQIADALGSTVVASLQARPSRTVSGWADLLAEYAPSTADAWALRQVLHQADRRLTVVSLSGDQDALAIGPQLASYAASTGLAVRLVLGQRHDSAAPLWASVHHGEDQKPRPGLVVTTNATDDPTAALTITVVVLDRRTSQLESVPPRGRTLVAVSAGTVTAEELARAAVTLDDAGQRIDGMVVANPDDLDHTTGRLPQRLRPAHLSLPSRLTGAIR